ncbi:MAG TPA: hypothetical protein VMA31_00265 [Bryobacteraceae bacterium]|nr:hypothetical protein [Bryobacteraceae bacterium]
MYALRKPGRIWHIGFIWAAVLLFAPMARANTTFFTDTGSVCSAWSPCWQASQFGVLVGLGSAVGSVGDLYTGAGSNKTIVNGTVGIGQSSYMTDTTVAETWNNAPIDFADNTATHSSGNCSGAGQNCVVPTADNITDLTLRTNSGASNGVMTLNDSLVTTGLSQVLSIASYWQNATSSTAGVTKVTSITTLGAQTIGTTAAGIYVYDVQSINLSGTLSILGGANTVIIINDTGAARFTGAATVTLSSTLTADQVLFNIDPTTGTVLTINASHVIDADFIVRGMYNVSNATLDGRLLGGWNTLTLGSAFYVNAPPSILPEPEDWVLMTGGLGALLYLGKRRTRPERQFPLGERFRERIEADAGESGECVPAAAGGTAGADGGDGAPPPEPGIPPPRGGGGGGSGGVDLAREP